MTVGLVEHEIAVQIADRYCAGEVRVSNLAKSVGVGVVNVAGPVGCNEQLRAVVGHTDRPSARHGANQRRRVGVVDLVELSARHHKTYAVIR